MIKFTFDEFARDFHVHAAWARPLKSGAYRACGRNWPRQIHIVGSRPQIDTQNNTNKPC